MTKFLARSLVVSLPTLLLAACGDGGTTEPSGTTPGEDVILEPGTAITLSLSAEQVERKAALDAQLKGVGDLSPSGFAELTRVEFEEIAYDPGEAEGLDLIENSQLSMTADERAKLRDNGFVITERDSFPTFAYGYASIYSDDLPIYVSADSILHALHRSYDNILKAFEQDSLIPELDALMAGMLSRLEAANYDGTLNSDLDVYLTVASSLLNDELQSPLSPSNASEVEALFEGCKSASGIRSTILFGSQRNIDFSQCEPRGHYTDHPNLRRYFRAMMWLGRIDFRMIETQQDDGSQVFRRRQLEAAWALTELMNDALAESHREIDSFITAFVGEHDYMTPAQMVSLKSDLGINDISELDDFTDAQLAQAIIDGGYGTQRISSHYLEKNPDTPELPLSSSYAFFGQRYVLDSHVFSNVVFDRTAERRMLPDPLDVAYAALGNNQAGMMLNDEIEEFDYATNLQEVRVIADSEAADFWEKNLYNHWLGALRELSPTMALSEAEGESLPAVAKTEAWGRRLLNTQLASWAELRHDTILYVKQSFTAGVACEFPDAYVEPYPRFFSKLQGYAEHATDVIENLSFPAPNGTTEHFENFADVAATLREMAEHQRTGTPHSEEHMAFINDMVTLQATGCAGPDDADGWYGNMIYGNPVEWEPTIADVHTDGENGQVLHVGTGDARLMITTVETCSGPRAYAGLVSSYYEYVSNDMKRLQDPEWEDMLRAEAAPTSIEWLDDVTVRQ